MDLTGYRIAIAKVTGASSRYLHLNTHGGRLQFATDGATSGHSTAATAIGVAATDATGARGAGGVFNGTESVETFSSDGPRRIFFRPAGQPITPGNFSSTGGLLLRKPDVTAADRVSTATPEFETFPGTSAAAPHAAAIAALMLQAAGGPGSLPRAQLLRAMQDTALDIEAPGDWDRDSGAGIIDALAAVGAVPRNPDSDLTPGGIARGVHLTELRTHIDEARRQCGLANVSWTDPDIVSGVTPIKAVHITQPRAALDAAYRACGQMPPAWTDPQIIPGVTSVKAVHFTELRDAVQGLNGTPGTNQAPEAVGAIPTQTLTMGGSASRVDVAPYFRDPDDDPLTFAATSSDPSTVAASILDSIVTLTPVAAGSATVIVTASDGSLNAMQTIPVTVSPSTPDIELGALTAFSFGHALGVICNARCSGVALHIDYLLGTGVLQSGGGQYNLSVGSNSVAVIPAPPLFVTDNWDGIRVQANNRSCRGCGVRIPRP